MRQGSGLCRFLLRLAGWKVVWVPPPGPRSVVMVYPHTSNWDFIVGILFRFGVGFKVHWAAKDTLFCGPLGWLFRKMGGVAVNRRERTGFVGQLIARFAQEGELHLAIAPESTRKYIDHLKSGFYRIAVGAGVPLGLGYIDYSRRTVGIEEWLSLSCDPAVDLTTLNRYYADKRGYNPAKAGVLRFKD